MSASTGEEEVAAALASLHDAVSTLLDLSVDMLSPAQSMQCLEALLTEARRLPVLRHALINHLAAHATEAEIGGKLPRVLADRMRITRAQARRWIAEADDLGPRRTMTGQPLPPRLPATADAQRNGTLDEAHITIIRQFFDHLPSSVDLPTCEQADTDLAGWGTQFRPDHLDKLAQKKLDCINQDGDYNPDRDHDRARQRGITIGKQAKNGMSPITGHLTPEARATFEAVLAKLAAPGMCNPDDQSPCVEGTPSEQAVKGDTRTSAQRHHDALLAGLRALLASGDLGQHHGLPATIIITTTLAELDAATGTGITGGGTRLPISDVIRLARHSHHYLAVFDNAKPIALRHTKRLASPGQRIMLYGKELGCTAPDCNVAGYYCEVHHVTPWAHTQRTDIEELTFACGPDHRKLDKPVSTGWKTRKNTRHDTEWIPPPHLDHGQPRTNTYHHPEKLLRDGDDDADAA